MSSDVLKSALTTQKMKYFLSYRSASKIYSRACCGVLLSCDILQVLFGPIIDKLHNYQTKATVPPFCLDGSTLATSRDISYMMAVWFGGVLSLTSISHRLVTHESLVMASGNDGSKRLFSSI